MLADLGHSQWEVRAEVLQRLLGLEGSQLAPYAEAVLPLVADPVSEVRRRACELIQKLELPVLHGLKDVPTDARMSFLRNGKTWKCLCVPGSVRVPPPPSPRSPVSPLSPPSPSLPSPPSPPVRRYGNGTEGPSHSMLYADSLSQPAARGFETPEAVRRNLLLELDGGLAEGAGQLPYAAPIRPEEEAVEWLGTLVDAPDLWDLAQKEPHWYHWKVRDALAFTVRDLQGTALVRLLADAEVAVREDALVALRRLPPNLWAHHTRCQPILG